MSKYVKNLITDELKRRLAEADETEGALSSAEHALGTATQATQDSLTVAIEGYSSTSRGETILFNGGSLPARYLSLTMKELESSLLGSGLIGQACFKETIALFDNPRFWTFQNSYVTTTAQKPLG